ncbi:hypothetical protein [Azospirillum picis]|uniref:DUF945 domain-containing protein n=1 Tax=Azospirillum picis TaxID=488438 RepID=A0ABU0MPA3_9PROT|nr:hypothetical protein [Azospirillum picis]MBP2301463.1 hypothetical protein [Azospirillum picis]MDQ0535295.1 hypothetical protein [Azospirillum picis]
MPLRSCSSSLPVLPVRSLRPALLAGGLLALVGAWSPSQAAVPAVDDAGARSLAATLKSGLARWFPPPTEDNEGVGFQWEGEPTVKPSGDHYEVALPSLSAEDAEGTLFDIGTILLTVTPKDEGLYGVSVTLPSALKVQNLDENDEYTDAATIGIGKQAITGTWSGAMETMLTLDAALGDLSVTAADGKGKVAVSTLTMVQDLKPEPGSAGNTLWSGPAAFALGNLSVLDEKNREMLKIGGIAAEGGYNRIDLTKIIALQRLSEQAAAKGTVPTSGELLPMMKGLFGGLTGKMSLTNLAAVSPEDGTKVTLGRFAFQMGLLDLDQALSNASFGMEASGFAMTPSPIPADFSPRKLEMKLSLAKVPNAALWSTFTDLAKAVEAEEEAPPPKKGAKPNAKAAKAPPAPPPAELAMQRAMAAMSEAGTEMRLDLLTIDTPATAGTATGALAVAAPAAFGVTGGATVLLRGIDAAVKAMQPKPGAKPDPNADPNAQSLMAGLAMLQALGQAGKDDSGADVRSYKFEVTEAGQFMLNGADMTPLLGGGAEAAPVEQPPAEPPKKTKK